MDGHACFTSRPPSTSGAALGLRLALGFLSAMLAMGIWLVPPRSASASIVVDAGTELWTPAGFATMQTSEAAFQAQATALCLTLWATKFDPESDLLMIGAPGEATSELWLQRDGEAVAAGSLICHQWHRLLDQKEHLVDPKSGVVAAVSLTHWLVAATGQASAGHGDHDVATLSSIPFFGLVLQATLQHSSGGSVSLNVLVTLAANEDVQKYIMAVKQWGAWFDAAASDEPVEIDCILSDEGKSDFIDCPCSCVSGFAGAMLRCAHALTVALLACGLIFIIVMSVIIAACPAATPLLFGQCIAGPAGLNLKILKFCAEAAAGAFVLCAIEAAWNRANCLSGCP